MKEVPRPTSTMTKSHFDVQAFQKSIEGIWEEEIDDRVTLKEARAYTIKGEMNMSKKTIVVVQFQSDNVAACEFNGKTYEYYTTMSKEDVGAMKFAVVMAQGKFRIVRVVEFRNWIDKDFRGDLTSIVAFFSDELYLAEIEKKKRLANLEKQLDEAMQKRSKLDLLEQLAEKDESFKELLTEYKNLTE